MDLKEKAFHISKARYGGVESLHVRMRLRPKGIGWRADGDLQWPSGKLPTSLRMPLRPPFSSLRLVRLVC
jgi:hypothetical protein